MHPRGQPPSCARRRHASRQAMTLALSTIRAHHSRHRCRVGDILDAFRQRPNRLASHTASALILPSAGWIGILLKTEVVSSAVYYSIL